jgi:hypothetical protein
MDSTIPGNVDPFTKGGRSVNTNFDNRNFDRESWKGMSQRLYSDVSNLFSREGELIRAEMSEKVVDVKAGAFSLVTGGVALFVGLLCVATTAIILLDMVAPLWLAAIIVTVVFLAIGAIMLSSAKKKLSADRIRPNKSIEAFGEIRHSLKEKVHEITKH